VDGAEADILLSLARALVADGEPQRARAVLSLLPQQRFAQRVQAKALTRPLSKGTSPCALAVTTGNCERHRAAPSQQKTLTVPEIARLNVPVEAIDPSRSSAGRCR